MNRTLSIALLLSLGALACRSAAPSALSGATVVVSADPALRAPLLEALQSLEGRWQGAGPDGVSKITEFDVIAEGTAVRETMMPGEPHEMVNMYTLDGNTLVMTHYCAGGNQPRMRAAALRDGRLEFRADGVADLNDADEVYMGALTLELVDANHVIQRWKGLRGGELDHEMVLELTRVE